MYDDIKSIIGKTISFIFWLLILSFCVGYTWGNYNGIKATLDEPRTFKFNIFPGYFVLSVDKHPEIPKYK